MRRNNTLNSFVWLRVECNRRCCNSRSRSCPCGRGGDGGAGDAGGAYDVGGRAGVCAGGGSAGNRLHCVAFVM